MTMQALSTFEPDHLANLVHVRRKNDGTIIPSDAGDLNVIHWNINRLKNKIDEVENYVASFPGTLHVIAISETWLTEHECGSTNVLGYVGFHNTRSGREGGGISIFVHDSLALETTPVVLQNVVTENLNHFFILQIPRVQVNIAVAYKRPLSSGIVFLEELKHCCLDTNNCLLMGDFNLNLLDHANYGKVIPLLEEYGYALLNEVTATATTRPSSATLLDICASNMLRSSYKLSILFNVRSDHGILAISVGKKIPASQRTTIGKRLDDRQASVRIEQLCAESDLSCGNLLNKKLEDIIEECSREVVIKSRYKIVKPYVTREIIEAIRDRDRMYSLTLLYPNNTSLLELYTDKRKWVKNELKRRRIQYENERIDQAVLDPSKSWQVYKEILFNTKNTKTDSKITINGVEAGTNEQSCNTINDKVCSTGNTGR